jgi:NitT/TauT family transport system substrate-binding protein
MVTMTKNNQDNSKIVRVGHQMNNKILFGIISILILMMNGCGEERSHKQVADSIKITLGVERSLLPAAVWVAESKGYFQKAGLDLTIKEFDSGKLSFLDMLAGDVDISTVAPTPIMFTSFIRQDFLIFATFVSSDNDIKVIANKDKGINTTKDLKGKRIGTPAGTTGQFILAAFLTYNGLFESDVEMVDINPSGLPEAINSGEVDAIIIWEPHGHNALKLLGDKAIRLPSAEVYRTTFNFMVMQDFARESPEALKRFLSAIDGATTFINTNKEEAQRVVSERLNLDKKLTNQLWDDFIFDVSLSQALIITLEDEARWAIKNKLTEKNKVPNYLDFIYLNALEAIKPEAISIIR